MQYNNVTTLNTTAQQEANLALRGLSYDGADFPVEYSPLYLEDGTRIPNKFASVNDDNGVVLGIHSDSYKPLSHKDMIDNQRDIIARSGLADSSVIETIRLDATGKRSFVTHELPNHSITTPDGDSAHLKFLAINSFNGSWPYITSAGAVQGACFNGQIFTSNSATLYKSRHNRHLDIAHAADVITRAIPIFMQQSELWHEWYGTSVDDYKALLIFTEVLENSELKGIVQQHMAHNQFGGDRGLFLTIRGEYLFDRKEIKHSRNLMYLWDKWNTHYRGVLGSNLWGVCNTLTDWATHVRGKSTNVAGIQQHRGKRIQKVLDNDSLGFTIAA